MATPVTPPAQPPRPVVLSQAPNMVPVYVMMLIMMVAIGILMWKLFVSPPANPTPLDAIDAAAKAWRDGEGPAYRSVGDRIGSRSIVNVKDVNVSLKETFSPAVTQLNDLVTSTLKSYSDKDGNITNPEAAKAVLYRVGAAFDEHKK